MDEQLCLLDGDSKQDWRVRTVRAMLSVLFPIAVLAPASANPLTGSEDTPLPVAVIESLQLQDPSRERTLDCKVYVPRTGGPYPVILFSHGFGGNKEAFEPVSRDWAGHGYVVIHPSHSDGIGRTSAGGNTDRPTRPPRLRSGGLTGALSDPQRITQRVGDLVLILDSLPRLAEQDADLKGKLDPSAVGVAGHSFGAYTAMLLGGVTADLGGTKARSFADPRVKCILPISGQGTGQQGLTEHSWKNLQLPMLTITGSRDRGAGGQDVDWKKEPFQFSPPGDKYLIVIEGASHFSFGGGAGARGGESSRIVARSGMLFWDAYLKNSEVAQQTLCSSAFAEESGGRFSVQHK